jgi:hypothetical protein
VITIVELASGHREPWKRFTTEPDVGTAAPLFVVTPDLKYYVYHSLEIFLISIWRTRCVEVVAQSSHQGYLGWDSQLIPGG